MRKIFRLSTLVVLLFLLAGTMEGCSTFRKIFSSPDPSLERNTADQSQKKKKKKKLNDDPVFDTLFHRENKRFPETQSELLSEEERAIVNSNRNSGKDPLVQGIYERNEGNRTKNQDWVFGTKDGSYFP